MFALFIIVFFSALIAHASPLLPRQEGISITFHNQHGRPIFISGDHAAGDINSHGVERLPSLDHKLQPEDVLTIPGLPLTSPKYFLSTTPNQASPEIGEKRDHDTAVEVTYVGYEQKTYWDVDSEKGLSVPVWCHAATDSWSSGQGCEGDVLAGCQPHLVHTGPDGVADQCWGEGTAVDVARRRGFCPTAYVVFNDEGTRTMMNGHGEWDFPPFLLAF